MMAPAKQTKPAYRNIPAYGSSDHDAKGSSSILTLRKTKERLHKIKPNITRIKAKRRFAFISSSFSKNLLYILINPC